jgi:hypothetical protein
LSVLLVEQGFVSVSSLILIPQITKIVVVSKPA